MASSPWVAPPPLPTNALNGAFAALQELLEKKSQKPELDAAAAASESNDRHPSEDCDSLAAKAWDTMPQNGEVFWTQSVDSSMRPEVARTQQALSRCVQGLRLSLDAAHISEEKSRAAGASFDPTERLAEEVEVEAMRVEESSLQEELALLCQELDSLRQGDTSQKSSLSKQAEDMLAPQMLLSCLKDVAQNGQLPLFPENEVLAAEHQAVADLLAEANVSLQQTPKREAPWQANIFTPEPHNVQDPGSGVQEVKATPSSSEIEANMY
eukprot:TRINITY_DN50696_c0_g1_i1.p1 TRINITY_DN50696_c0_g1~~TRINITY_DN50696_c0_g1_i1.p1  ORF type:complete len:268 (-),score=70.38 TRINITY_DN50696_c0_g1_i1:17-820(-)